MDTKEKFVELVGAYTCIQILSGMVPVTRGVSYQPWTHGVRIHKMMTVPLNAPRVTIEVDQIHLVLPYTEYAGPRPASFSNHELPSLDVHVRGFKTERGQYFDEGSLLKEGETKSEGRLTVLGYPIAWEDLSESVLEARCTELKGQLRGLNNSPLADDLFRFYPNLRRFLYTRTEAASTA